MKVIERIQQEFEKVKGGFEDIYLKEIIEDSKGYYGITSTDFIDDDLPIIYVDKKTDELTVKRIPDYEDDVTVIWKKRKFNSFNRKE